MGSEVSYNRCRYGVLHKGQLGLYQVGSPSLGQLVGADDIEKATVGWDVFRIAKLVDLKVCLALASRLDKLHTCSMYGILLAAAQRCARPLCLLAYLPSAMACSCFSSCMAGRAG